MENNFGGFNHLPDQNSFQRRNDYSISKTEPLDTSKNKLNVVNNGLPKKDNFFQSVDGRKWETRDQSIVANQEYYKKIGREINHKENPNAFTVSDFYGFNKD